MKQFRSERWRPDRLSGAGVVMLVLAFAWSLSAACGGDGGSGDADGGSLQDAGWAVGSDVEGGVVPPPDVPGVSPADGASGGDGSTSPRDAAVDDARATDGTETDIDDPDVDDPDVDDPDVDDPDVDRVPCPDGLDDPRCDDGNPCTHDACDPDEGGCAHSSVANGSPCVSSDVCGEGRCLDERCVDHSACDDVAVCTEDLCDGEGACDHRVIDPVGRRAVDFELVDTNPYSATFMETVTLESLRGRVAVLVFMASGCEPCCLQGEAARPLVEEFRNEPEVFIAAVDVRSVLLGGTPESIETCVTMDGDGAPPLVSDWPYLRDNDVWQVWNRYCAVNYLTVIIGVDGDIWYYREVNFEDGPFRQEVQWAIDAARGREVPGRPRFE